MVWQAPPQGIGKRTLRRQSGLRFGLGRFDGITSRFDTPDVLDTVNVVLTGGALLWGFRAEWGTVIVAPRSSLPDNDVP